MQLISNMERQYPEVTVEHRGKELSFAANAFFRKSFDKGFDVFAEINHYWSELPMEVQDQIFEIYREIYNSFDSLLSSEQLSDTLSRAIVKLKDHHPLDSFMSWIWRTGRVQIPEGIKEAFVEEDSDRKLTRDKTYTRLDYVKLVSWCMFMRCLLPVWGEYIASIRREVGVDRKEFVAFQLLINTGLLETEPVQKLKVYIAQISNQKKMDWGRILSGVSSEDLWFWLLALVCIRRLCVGDIRGLDPKSHLVSEVYSFLYNKMFNNTETDKDIKPKKFSGEGGNTGGDKRDRSILESYRKRTDLSIAELEAMVYAMENVEGIAQRLAPGIDMGDVYASIQTAQRLITERLGDPQLTLMSWVFARVISPYAILYIPKLSNQYNQELRQFEQIPVLINAFGVLEAVLWHHGHHYLSMLSSASQQTDDKVLVVSPIDSRGQIPSEIQEQILKLYPYNHSSWRRSTNQVHMDQNHALQAIDMMVDQLAEGSWRATASEEKLEKTFGEKRRTLPIRSSIKIDIAKLVVDVGSRKWLNK